MRSNGHVFLSRRLTDAAMDRLAALDIEVVTGADPDWPPSREELLDAVRGAAGVLVLLTEAVDPEFLDAAGPGLRVVANCAVGVDNIDVAAAERRGVVVTNTPGVLDQATADLAFGLILATTRRIVEADRFLRSGARWVWDPRMFTGLDLSAGAVLGIVGLGRIGMAVARRATAFGMRILATGSRATGAEAAGYGVEAADLDRVLNEADVVTLHCPLTPGTHHLVGARQLRAMKPSAILVNTARGPVVDEQALVDALEAGEIAGAGLDVFEDEPRVHPRLAALDNVVIVPHIGSAGAATRDAMGILAVDNLAAVLRGDPPLTPVTS